LTYSSGLEGTPLTTPFTTYPRIASSQLVLASIVCEDVFSFGVAGNVAFDRLGVSGS